MRPVDQGSAQAVLYRGEIPASKSQMNRALLIQSYFPDLKIVGNSNCDDVKYMKNAIASYRAHQDIFCGEAGTVLRFMALRASRTKGFWRLTGSPRLFERPQEDLVFILNQLGVACLLNNDSITIQSEGWKKPLIPIQIHRQSSSQFASSVLLNSWDLPFSLEFELHGHGVSEGYWQMSKTMAEELGMTIENKKDGQVIPAKQKIRHDSLKVEMDYSSGFVVAAAAVLGGRVQITNCDENSLQPDYVFIEVLKKMGAKIDLHESTLSIESVAVLRPIEMSLESCPDLFPVLAVLCAFTSGKSKLFGAPHLALKESNRIIKTAELLTLAGVSVQTTADGLTISGVASDWKPKSFVFDPDKDHRMAMAAALLRFRSCPVKIVHPEVVSKSFPEFWNILGFHA